MNESRTIRVLRDDVETLIEQLTESKAECARLAGELADLRQFHNDYAEHTAASHRVMVETVDELERERDAARAALASIAEAAATWEDAPDPWKVIESIEQAARAALNATPHLT